MLRRPFNAQRRDLESSGSAKYQSGRRQMRIVANFVKSTVELSTLHRVCVCVCARARARARVCDTCAPTVLLLNVLAELTELRYANYLFYHVAGNCLQFRDAMCLQEFYNESR